MSRMTWALSLIVWKTSKNFLNTLKKLFCIFTAQESSKFERIYNIESSQEFWFKLRTKLIILIEKRIYYMAGLKVIIRFNENRKNLF